ncbi:hypothetical protein SAMN04487970_105229 [Paenibacillus tianmuensis]|uniref:Phr family secreted Rap phosphatase inhibitor n=1 Tax=Paenibacillus tianmuensis TaxID=624147 RepID=A0A1G4THF9_9BACL|nr:hypothetical protein [Paenibacillus tianmuensis]SCW80702.1 hypothetical protein SAMN04487970_105229 [Paenibacillus tianmuensis]
MKKAFLSLVMGLVLLGGVAFNHHGWEAPQQTENLPISTLDHHGWGG